MKIAFLILAHKQPEHLARLISRLETPDRRFYIHVDRRTSRRVYLEFQNALASHTSATLVPRYSTPWGGYGAVLAEIRLLRNSLQSAFEYDYAVLLSGQDYPVKSNHEIDEALKRANGCSLLDFEPFPQSTWDDKGYGRIQNWHVRVMGRIVSVPAVVERKLGIRLPARAVPKCDFYGGSSYWALSRSAAECVVSTVDRSQAFLKFFKHVLCPDEIFFQTLLHQSDLRESLINAKLTLSEFQGKHARVLSSFEVEKIVSSTALFARKFDSSIDREVLNLIDRHLDRVEDHAHSLSERVLA